MIRTVRIWPDESLRLVAEKVDDVLEVQDVVRDLIETMDAYRAQGISATQIGEDKRIIVVKDGPLNRVLINPEILSKQGMMVAKEGCLSFPGVRAPLKRSETLDVVYLDEHGSAHKWSPEGVSAVAVQHEVDHLNGVVMLDHMTRMEKNIALRRLRKTKKRLFSK